MISTLCSKLSSTVQRRRSGSKSYKEEDDDDDKSKERKKKSFDADVAQEFFRQKAEEESKQRRNKGGADGPGEGSSKHREASVSATDGPSYAEELIEMLQNPEEWETKRWRSQKIKTLETEGEGSDDDNREEQNACSGPSDYSDEILQRLEEIRKSTEEEHGASQSPHGSDLSGRVNKSSSSSSYSASDTSTSESNVSSGYGSLPRDNEVFSRTGNVAELSAVVEEPLKC